MNVYGDMIPIHYRGFSLIRVERWPCGHARQLLDEGPVYLRRIMPCAHAGCREAALSGRFVMAIEGGGDLRAVEFLRDSIARPEGEDWYWFHREEAPK